MKILSDYWISWLLGAIALISFTTAALIFQFNAREEFVIAAFLQAAAVFLALAIAYTLFERRSHQRQSRIDAVLVESANNLRDRARAAVINATGEIWAKPEGHDSYGPDNKTKVYEEAKQLVLERSHQVSDYRTNVHRADLYWIFRRYEDLAYECSQIIRTLSPALVEYGKLRRSMLNYEEMVNLEQRVWDELYRIPTGPDPDAKGVPADAEYNLLVLAEMAVHLIDVIDSKNYVGDPDYDREKLFAPPTFHRSRNWGLWR